MLRDTCNLPKIRTDRSHAQWISLTSGDTLFNCSKNGLWTRVFNLETSITKSGEYWKGKEIHYRMNPENVPCLSPAKIDCCCLANNHILDWGYSGLTETLETLNKANIKHCGAGNNIDEAESPAVFEAGGRGKGKVIIFSFGSETSGIPRSWAASENKPGVNLLRDLSDETINGIKEKVKAVKGQNDVAVASIHWGANWGYEVPIEQR